jgi:hypothetical protein
LARKKAVKKTAVSNTLSANNGVSSTDEDIL